MNSTLQHALEVHYIKLHFTLEMEEDVILPENKGSALRGGIGEMLLRANCIQNRECEKCHFSSECIIQHTLYSKFEKKPSFVTTGESIGYVIECEDYRKKFTAGDTLKFQLLLLGKTVVYFNLFLQAIHTLGMNGLGTNAGHFHILHIANNSGEHILDNVNIYMEKYRVEKIKDYVQNRLEIWNKDVMPSKIVFETPLTLKYNGKFLNEFNMDSIIRSVKRRIYMLDCFEGVEGDLAYDQNYLVPQIIWQRADRIKVRRFSSRKQSAMYLNGIRGELEIGQLEHDTLELLLAGELVHIGKNTSFGFGKYRIKE